jgi:hypothetical protein
MEGARGSISPARDRLGNSSAPKTFTVAMKMDAKLPKTQARAVFRPMRAARIWRPLKKFSVQLRGFVRLLDDDLARRFLAAHLAL